MDHFSGPPHRSLRGLPNGHPNQQSTGPTRNTQAPGRPGAANMAPTNGSTWAFGGVPMGSAGMPQRGNNMATFAQSLGGASQPSTPLDLSDFPTLSSNAPHPQSNSQSTWAMPNVPSRRQGQSLMGGQPQSQARQQVQQQQDELFSSSSQLPSSQAAFRYGGQNPVGRASQSQDGGDDFPVLRNSGAEIGQGIQSQGSNNGLLNALNSGGSRTSPSGNPRENTNNLAGTNASFLHLLPSSFFNTEDLTSGPPSSRSPAQNSAPGLEKDTIGYGRPSQSESSDAAMRNQPAESAPADKPPMSFAQAEGMEPLAPTDRLTADPAVLMHGEDGPMIQDPLPGMSDRDRFGLKGLFGILKGPYPDQAALITGIDINSLGLDLNSNERLSEMVWSPFDDAPARPAVMPHKIPECYQVHNVAPVEAKLSNFSDETLMMMFYNNPQDVQQMIAAEELRNRNWRYHKKLMLWLTKDEMMNPVQVGNGVERGYYIVFDPKQWVRERREMLLNYLDLETAPPPQNGPVL